ncbi:MAG: hypothetical protein Q9184_007910 [Pyrenodesmia sp. 2 TL-2023]
MAPVNDMTNNFDADFKDTGTDPNEWKLKGIANFVLYLIWSLGVILVVIIIGIVSSKSYRTRVVSFLTKVFFGISRSLTKAMLGIGNLIFGIVQWVSDTLQKTTIFAGRAFRNLHMRLRSKPACTQHEAIELQTGGHKNASTSPPTSAASPVILTTFAAAGGDVELGDTQNRQECASSTLGSQDVTGHGFGISFGKDSEAKGTLEQRKGPSSTLENGKLAEQDLSVREASEDYIRQGLV